MKSQESTRAAKAMMDTFGVSGEEAMSLIAAGAQNGLDYSGELLDSISEYSVQFGKLDSVRMTCSASSRRGLSPVPGIWTRLVCGQRIFYPCD